MHAVIALLTVLFFSLPAFASDDLAGTWIVTDPEGGEIPLPITLELREDGTVTMESEIPDGSGGIFPYVSTGLWAIEEGQFSLNLVEGYAIIEGEQFKDDSFEAVHYTGSVDFPAPDRLVLNLVDENGTGVTIYLSRAATAVRPISWGRLKFERQSQSSP